MDLKLGLLTETTMALQPPQEWPPCLTAYLETLLQPLKLTFKRKF